MKSLFTKFMAFSMFILLFMSCKKDETKVVAGNGTAAAVTSSALTTQVLKEENAAVNFGVFNWTASTFGFEGSVVSYTVQVDISGNNFKAPKEISAGSLLTKTITVADINSITNQLKLTNGVAGKIDLRVKATISDKHPAAYSNTLTFTVTPYQIIIDYPSLYVPGAYQGWAPATASKISSVEDNKMYEGYIYFPDPVNEFKITSAPNWDNIIYGTSAAGKIVAGAGDNLKINGAGYYQLKANTTALTYSAVKTTWAVMGSGTGNVEAPMTYDNTTKVWTVTKALSAGTIKFRANGTDDINFGSNATADGTLVAGGTAIPVTAGTYKITFNVSIPGNYVYSILLQ
ncbi:SusE domain-containing protein [Pedobacter westerhofensis]|nr:SusE domain-containing protein [Pedobacter westerhofensis]